MVNGPGDLTALRADKLYCRSSCQDLLNKRDRLARNGFEVFGGRNNPNPPNPEAVLGDLKRGAYTMPFSELIKKQYLVIYHATRRRRALRMTACKLGSERKLRCKDRGVSEL